MDADVGKAIAAALKARPMPHALMHDYAAQDTPHIACIDACQTLLNSTCLTVPHAACTDARLTLQPAGLRARRVVRRIP